MIKPRWFPLKSTQKKAQISGEIQLQFSLTDSSDPATPAEQIFQKWQLWVGSFIGTPPSDEETLDRQLGEAGIDLDDEEEESSDEADEAEPRSDEGSQVGKTAAIKSKKDKVKKKIVQTAYEFTRASDVVGVVYLEISKITDLPPEHNSKYMSE